jgi:DNA repair protein RadC
MKPFNSKEWKVVCLRETPAPECAFACDNEAMAAEYWTRVIATDPRFNGDVESLYALHLNARRRITGHHLVAQGLLDTLLCHSREVFRAAIVANAAAIIVMHNHPSGDPTPSNDDVRVTRNLISAGTLLKIEVLDHIVMGRPSAVLPTGFHSLKQLGYFH